MTSGKRIGAVFDDVATRSAVAAIMDRCDFTPHELGGPVSTLVSRTRELSSDLLVFDLPSAGTFGFAIVRDLRRVLPACAVVALAPFEGLRKYALEAGAYDLVVKEDLRHLMRSLRRLRGELEARDSAAV